MDPRLETLEELTHSLRNLLSLLDGGAATAPEGIARVWERCTDSFERFQEFHDDPAHHGDAAPEQIQAVAEEALRLYAVAAHAVASWSEELAGERTRLKGARTRLDGLRGEARVGRSCDLAG